MRRFLRRLRALRRLDRDLEDELRFHLEMKAAESGDPGASRRSFGNTAALKETCREIWSFPALESCWHDLRYALRAASKNVGFTLIAVIALAFGIGADTAVFTIASGALSWNLGLDHLERIVLVNTADRSHRRDFGSSSYSDFRDLRAQTKSLAGLAAYDFSSVNVADSSGLPERFYGVRMSANGFFVAEMKPALGRGFSPDDERPGAPSVVVLSYHVWQDRYGQDPLILGRRIRVNDVPMAVIGVMPPRRRFPEDTDLWMPLVPDARLEKRDNRGLMLFGRLRQDVTLAAARTELDTIGRRLSAQFADTNPDLTAEVRPVAEITGVYAIRPLFVVLWAAAGFVLLIACSNVANMLLARGAGRAREISIRLAIGAGRARIVRQLLIESVVLSLAGGLLGWPVARGGLAWFERATSSVIRPPWLNLSLDTAAFVYLAAISLATGLLFGLVPALRLAKVDVHTAIKDGGHGVAGGRRGIRLANWLVTFEMALCVVLLVAAGLLIRSAIRIYSTPVGADTAGVLTMRINLPEVKYPRPEDEVAFHSELKARLEALPGVETAALASNMPLGGAMSFPFETEGAAAGAPYKPRIGTIVISAGYFPALRVAPSRGRLFSESDGSGMPVVIINESFAARFWPGADPLGKRLRILREHAAQPWLTVVGVVPDILQNNRDPMQRDPLLYLPYRQEPQRITFLMARTRIPPAGLADAFRRVVQSMDGNLPVYDVRTLDDFIAHSRLSVRVFGGTLSVFALVALLLASIGLYAVMAHAVSQRTREIGVRIAMGGARRDILALVFAQGMRPLARGLAIGLPLSFFLSRALQSMPGGVKPADPLMFASVVVVLSLAGVLGCAIPARRALRVDPVKALRCD